LLAKTVAGNKERTDEEIAMMAAAVKSFMIDVDVVEDQCMMMMPCCVAVVISSELVV